MNRLPILLAILVGLGLFAWFGDTSVRQARWMAESHEALPMVRSRLAADPRFARIVVGVGTGGDILVVGDVDCEQDQRDVQALLGELVLPHGFSMVVRVQ